jgi:hypothetical protein
VATKKAGTTSTKKAASVIESTEETPKPSAKKAAAKKVPAKSAVPEMKSAVPEEKLPGKKKPPTHAEIAALAYSYWEKRGHHHGSHHDDWARAEKELSS